jgi:hypothetical protein
VLTSPKAAVLNAILVACSARSVKTKNLQWDIKSMKQLNTRAWLVLFLSSVSAFFFLVTGLAPAAESPRLVIFDNDFLGPASSNLQAAALLLSSPDVKVLGLTVVTGDGWRDENVAHTLRFLEIMHRPGRAGSARRRFPFG